MITRTDILAHLERNVRVGFLAGQKGYNVKRTPFVNETTSDGAFEIYSDMGAVPWPRHNGGQTGYQGKDTRTDSPKVGGLHEGGPITVLGGNERSLEVFNQDWDIPIGITHSAINDDKAGDLETWARMAGARFEQHMDYLAFDALNSGEATTNYGACFDNLSFFNNSHVYPNAEYTTAQDNLYSVALSLDNFETVRVAGAKFLDDRGKPLGLSHNLLIVPPDLERTAAQICDNKEDYGTGNRAMNPYAGTMKYIVAPGGYLDTTSWFVAAVDMPAKPLILQIRERPNLVTWDDHTQGSGVRYFKWIARYTIAYGDWTLCVQGRS